MWRLKVEKRTDLIGLLVVVFVGGLLAGCSEEGGGEGSAESVIHTYTVRGRIVQLPEPGSPASELLIHHEAIDDFKYGDGSPAPMASMTMPFPPAPGVLLGGFAVDDVVAFSFDVQWEPSPGMSLTAVRKLPADTVLDFDEVTGE